MNNGFKRAIKYIVFILAFILVPQSLNVQSELNMRVVVSAIAIDYEEGEYSVTAQVVKPSSTTEGGSAEIDFLSAKGKTIVSAVEEVSFILGRTTGFSHISAIILGQGVLKEEKTMEALDYFVREKGILNSALLLVAEEKAKDELEKTKKLQLSSAVGIQKTFLYKELNSNAVMMQLQTFFNDYFAKSKCSVISGFKIESKDEQSGSSSGGGESGGGSSGGGGESSGGGMTGGSSGSSGSSGGSSGGEKDGRIKFLNNIYVFRDGKLKTELKEEDELRGINYINKNSKEGIVTVEKITNENMKNANVSLYFRDKKVKLRVQFNDNSDPTAKITITTNRNEIYAIETEETNPKLYETEETYLTEDIKKAVEEKIKDCILKAYTKCQEEGADILQLGNRLYKQNPKKWRELLKQYGEEEYIKHINLDVEVIIKDQI